MIADGAHEKWNGLQKIAILLDASCPSSLSDTIICHVCKKETLRFIWGCWPLDGSVFCDTCNTGFKKGKGHDFEGSWWTEEQDAK